MPDDDVDLPPRVGHERPDLDRVRRVACIVGAGVLAVILPRYRRYDAANPTP